MINTEDTQLKKTRAERNVFNGHNLLLVVHVFADGRWAQAWSDEYSDKSLNNIRVRNHRAGIV